MKILSRNRSRLIYGETHIRIELELGYLLKIQLTNDFENLNENFSKSIFKEEF
jgi:hypothetical protein